MQVRVTHIDTACILLELNGYRILTDPVLDPAGSFYHFGWGTFSKKLKSPAMQPRDLGRVDLVLLSHDQHEDNLDHAGREFIKTVPRVLSTRPAARRIKGIEGLDDWQSVAVETPQVPGFRITAVPAQHTSLRILNPIAGKVIGFILEWQGQKHGAYYISGDTVLFKGIHQIAQKFPAIDTAFFHTGRAGFPYLTANTYYTFHAKEALKAFRGLKPRRMIPVHYDGWWHFREKTDQAQSIYAASDESKKILWIERGKATDLE
jgi:L-ascorbate metabolism protein UlaG (beta-lactamase superfamily)